MNLRVVLLAFFFWLPLSGNTASTVQAAREYYQFSPEEFRKLAALNSPIIWEKLNVPLLDAAVYHETNSRRVKEGLPALGFSKVAHDAARYQSEAMAKYEFVGHENAHDKRKETLKDRLSLAGVSPRMAAENVANAFALNYESGSKAYVREANGKKFLSKTPDGPALGMRTYQQFAEALVDSWMKSPGHRKNILHKTPAVFGCSCLPELKQSDMRKVYCTQVFLKVK